MKEKFNNVTFLGLADFCISSTVYSSQLYDSQAEKSITGTAVNCSFIKWHTYAGYHYKNLSASAAVNMQALVH